jgi:hypothetical protein
LTFLAKFAQIAKILIFKVLSKKTYDTYPQGDFLSVTAGPYGLVGLNPSRFSSNNSKNSIHKTYKKFSIKFAENPQKRLPIPYKSP